MREPLGSLTSMSNRGMTVKYPMPSSQGSLAKQWAFGLQWMLAGTLGWSLGWIAFIIAVEAAATSRWLGSTIASIISYNLWDFVRELAAFAAFGAALGTTQWFVLWQKLHRASWWILASATGIAMGWFLERAVGVCISHVEGVSLSGIEGWAAFGIVLGVMQWLVLRTRVHRAGWWILASLAALVLGGVAAEVGDHIAGFFHSKIAGIQSPIDVAIDFAILAIFGTVREAITGLVLLWLLRHPILKNVHLWQEAA